LINEVGRHRLTERKREKEKEKEKECERRWIESSNDAGSYIRMAKKRRMGWPRSERSDAIMDLRAASRNSKISLGLPPLSPSPFILTRISVHPTERSPFFFLLLQEARGLHYLVRCTLHTTISARREDTSFIGIPFAQFLRIPNRRPTGFWSPQGLWHSHRAYHIRA